MRHSICTDHLLWAVRSAISQQTAGLLVHFSTVEQSCNYLYMFSNVAYYFYSTLWYIMKLKATILCQKFTAVLSVECVEYTVSQEIRHL